eukprot:GFYU01012927.1.p2 GENE.GFYU01012927.1~~GFYU01012927.1.p2  ORF type:complete len:160 (-),score=46.86 GFYU01012927.1:336-815(-)
MDRRGGSILQRPIRSQSNKNNENMDGEYEKQQARLAAARAQRARLDGERVKSLFGSPTEKVQLQEQRRREMEEHLRLKNEQKQRELYDDLQAASQLNEHVTLNQVVEQDQNEARRAYLKDLMETNKAIMAEKERKKRMEKDQDRDSGNDFFASWRVSAR